MKIMTALALASGLLASPSLAEGISGTWTCEMAGIAVGDLHVEPDRYTYTRPGITLASMSADEVAQGAYTVDLTVSNIEHHLGPITNTLVHVSTGPLRDIFGIKLGFLNDKQSPARLAFNIRPGLGLICSPV